MLMSLNITIRLKLANRPGTLANVLAVIARERGSLGAIDLVSASPQYVTREMMVRLRDRNHLDELVDALKAISGVQIIHVADRVLTKHLGGKIEIKAKRPVANWEDLSMIIHRRGRCRKQFGEPDLAYKLTMKGNSVAIVTDGSAVLGLGNSAPAPPFLP